MKTTSYMLLKDLPNVMAGEVFYEDDGFLRWIKNPAIVVRIVGISHFDQWFKQIGNTEVTIFAGQERDDMVQILDRIIRLSTQAHASVSDVQLKITEAHTPLVPAIELLNSIIDDTVAIAKKF